MVYGWIFVVNVNIKVQKLIKINSHKKGSGTMKPKYKVYCGLFDGEQCPYCGSTKTEYNNYHKDWICRSCGKYFDRV